MADRKVKINFDAPATLRKWPSLNNERVSASLRLQRDRSRQAVHIFQSENAPATVFHRVPSSLVIVGFGAPVELSGNASYKGVRRFPEPFPFRSFCQPVVHISFRNRSPLTAHAFLRSKLICCPHDASPLTTPLLCQRREEVGCQTNHLSCLPYPQPYPLSSPTVTPYL